MTIPEIREHMSYAFAHPIEPQIVASGSCQAVVQTEGIDLERSLPILKHAPKDVGKFITGSIVVIQDPETGIRNASFHRLQILGPDTTGIRVKKRNARDDGLQRNAVFAAFATQKDLDLVVVVDDDIDVHNLADVEWAMLMRFDATNDVMIMSGARTHEYIRASDNGIRGKIAFDATVPYDQRKRFERVQFQDVQLDRYRMTTAPEGPAVAPEVARA